MKEAQANFPLALDGTHKRVFVGCRKPARLLVLDMDSGKTIAKVECVGDTDDLFYDVTHERIYISGGEGAITVVQQSDADHYKAMETIKTTAGARTSFFSPDLKQLYLAVPHRAG